MNHWACACGRTLVGGILGELVLDARMRRRRGRLSITGHCLARSYVRAYFILFYFFVIYMTTR